MREEFARNQGERELRGLCHPDLPSSPHHISEGGTGSNPVSVEHGRRTAQLLLFVVFRFFTNRFFCNSQVKGS